MKRKAQMLGGYLMSLPPIRTTSDKISEDSYLFIDSF